MRNTRYVTITADGRDKGKVFFLTEMPTRVADKWATRALMAVAKANQEIPQDILSAGMLGIVYVGIKGVLSADFAEAEPLLDQMLDLCVEFVPDPTRREVKRPLVDSDVDEVRTLAKLRDEVFELHTGFSVAAQLSLMISRQQSTTQANDMRITPTSGTELAPSSAPDTPNSTS